MRRRGEGRGRAIVPVLLLALLLPASGAALPDRDLQDEDWASSPEAIFLTREELADWRALDSRESRAAFKERYWLKRDPSPGSEKNEFREAILARIRTADERYALRDTRGSRTARGRALVLFGTPARIQNEHAAPLRDARPDNPDRSPVGLMEGNETTSTWTYDRERTPRIVEAVGQPTFELRFVIEPSRRSDRLQNPGLMNDFREILAKKSIANPDLIPPGEGRPARVPSDSLPRDVLSSSARALLDAAPGSIRSAGGAVFGSAILWPTSGDPETLVWFFAPPSRGKRTFLGSVRPEGGGAEATSFFERAIPSSEFSTARPGEVVLRRLPLPPGNYDAAFVLLDEASGAPTASIATTLRVPSLADAFAVSSLLVTRGPASSPPGRSPFAIGASRLPPRADAAFSHSESLWYFLEVANPTDPAAVTLEPRVRRGSETVAGLAPFAAGLAEVGPGRYLCGVELPLSEFAPGDYVLYVTLRDGIAAGSPRVVRRADFRVLEH